MLQATLPEIKLALSSKSRDLLSHVISECMQMRGRINKNKLVSAATIKRYFGGQGSQKGRVGSVGYSFS